MELGDFVLDLFDVAIVGWIFYRLLLVFRQTRAIRVVLGLLLLALVYGIASWLRFEGLLGLVDALRGNGTEIGVVILALIFSEEIKDAMSGMFWRYSGRPTKPKVVDEVTRACAALAARGTGALIAICRSNPLDHWILADSVKIDSKVSSQLLETIFAGKSPLHDGAVIIRNGRIISAKCQFPASSDARVTALQVGMRHRAAVGVSERSDALAVAVSEERGAVSLADGGVLSKDIPIGELGDELRKRLRLGTVKKRWYHPARLLSHGWIKLLALVLAVAVWGAQETTFRVELPVYVREGTERTFKPGNDVLVVASPSSELRARGENGEYAQVLQSVSVELIGANRSRLLMLGQLVGVWVSGGEVASLLDTTWVQFPVLGEMELKALPKPYDLPLSHAGGVFTLAQDTLPQVMIDKLVRVESDSIGVLVTGQPDEGYREHSQRKFQREGALWVPSMMLPAVSEKIGQLETEPPIVLRGKETLVFDNLELKVPPILSAWNPAKENFIARLTVPIASEEDLATTAEILRQGEDRLRLLDEQRVAARSRRDARSDAWARLERLFSDGTWERSYSLNQLRTLERHLPELDKRIEKAEIDRAAVQARYDRSVASGDAGPVARVTRDLDLRELGLRDETLRFLREERDLAARELEAVQGRLRERLDAVEAAVRKRDEIVSEPSLPAGEPEPDLPLLVDASGPLRRGDTSGAQAIAVAASHRPLLQLVSRAGTSFERWADAVQTMESRLRRLDELHGQLASGTPPAGTSQIRLELQLVETEALYEAAARAAQRQTVMWTELKQRLGRALATFSKESERLRFLTERWPQEELDKLAPEPFIELFRGLQAEVAAIGAARDFVEQRSRPRAPVIVSTRAAQQELAKFSAAADTLQASARAEVEVWRTVEDAVRRRLGVLAATVAGIVLDEGARPVTTQLDRRIVALDSLAVETRRARAHVDSVSDPALDALTDARRLRAELERQSAELDARIATREAEIARLAASIDSAPADTAAVRQAAARWCIARAHALFDRAALRQLKLRSAAVAQLEEKLLPLLQPLLSTLDARRAEHEQLKNDPQPDRAAALEYVRARRAERPLLESLAVRLPRATLADTARLATDLAAAFAPPTSVDNGFDLLDRLETRILQVNEQIAQRAAEQADTTQLRSRAQVEQWKRVKASELAMRGERLSRLEAAERELAGQLFDTRFVTLARLVRDEVDPDVCAALPLGPLQATAEQLRASIERRSAELEVAKRDAQSAAPPEAAPFLRRVQRLERLLDRLRTSRLELARLLEELRSPAP